ncbi:MAG: hypothetical protein QOH26_738, partial [Actinomycetota bacterium]|nr:hypothetical protein [Actinomycetota bacterium]
KGHYAYVTGWEGIQILDIADPADPQIVGFQPLPHFENEDVDLCGNTLLVSNDREREDYGAVLYVFDISDPETLSLQATLPVGLAGGTRGGGHIANFVKKDCSQVWLDGGNNVDVIDLTDPAAPKHLGKFESKASMSEAFKVSHDTELDSQGIAWNVGGGGAAGYKLTSNPLKPKLLASTGKAAVNPSKTNDFILHNSQRRGNTLLITEEDYVDTDEVPPGSCHGQGHFETWSLSNMDAGKVTFQDMWETELNGFIAGGSEDSKAPVTANCSSHWFDTKAGISAVGWYEQGVRFLDSRNPTKIRQVGYYIPPDGSVWAAYWSPTDKSGQIVYTADAQRGIDVLRIKGGGRKAGTPTVKAPILKRWFGTTPSVGYIPSERFGYACPIKNI